MNHYFSGQKCKHDLDSDFSSIDLKFPASGMNVSEIRLSSRYPEKGYALNTKSQMIVRVIEGSVSFHCEGESVVLVAGDSVFVENNKKYCWAPDKFVVLYIVSNPPWSIEQAKCVYL